VEEREVLTLREQIKQLSVLLKQKEVALSAATRCGGDDSDSAEILRGKFEALTKINTTLRNENKTLNFRLKNEFVPIADFEKLKARVNAAALNKVDEAAMMSRSLCLFPLVETPPQSARRSTSGVGGGRFSVDMKPLDLESLRNGTTVLPRVTARQTARLAAEDEEKQQLERRVNEAIADVAELTMEQAVEFTAKLLGGAALPKVHVFRLFRFVVSEGDVLLGERKVREFAKLVLKFN
jgi:hypothetical protein